MNERRFTLEEADAMLPELRERLARIRQARETVIDGTQRMGERIEQDGGGVEGSALYEAGRILRAEVEALNAAGVVLRDSATGLVDFPSERDGAAIFLCWRDGEERVTFWHPPDTGFSGRQPL